MGKGDALGSPRSCKAPAPQRVCKTTLVIGKACVQPHSMCPLSCLPCRQIARQPQTEHTDGSGQAIGESGLNLLGSQPQEHF